MSDSGFIRFLRDESGAYTIWSLVWFSLYVAMGGLAVDVTDAYRNQTILQSTADASALAAVMSLPEQDDAVVQALLYSSYNMDPAINGNVLDEAEVFLGNWDFDDQIFTAGDGAPDAVRVITRRDESNNNPLATNFLRILSLWGIPIDSWNISVEAVAVRYVPDCLRDGFVSYNWVDMNGGNHFYNDICIHGQNEVEDHGQDYGIDIGMGNTFEGPSLDGPGVTVSTPYPDQDITNKNPTCGLNEGLCGPNGAKVAGDLWPTDVDRVGNFVNGLRTLDPDFLPDFMVDVAEGSEIRTTAAGVLVETLGSLPETFVENTVYIINCNGQIKLPGVLISGVVIVASCRIHSASGLRLEDAVLATSYAGNNAAISIAAQSTIGRADYCESGGGVEFYTPGNVHIAAGGDWHGLRIVSGGNVKFTSMNVGVYGISVQAKNKIDMSSNNEFGLCTGGVPGQFAWHYRLVR